MPDDLDIRIKSIIEADEAKSAERIESQLPSISNKIKGKIKIKVEADADTASNIQKSVDDATKSAKGTSISVPVKVKLDDKYLREGLQQDFRKFKAQSKDLQIDTSGFEKAFNVGNLQTARAELTLLFKTLHAMSAENITKLPDLSITNFSQNIRTALDNINLLESRFKKLATNTPSDITSKISSIRQELEGLSKIGQGQATDADIKSFNNLKIAIGEVSSALTKLRVADTNFKLDVGAKQFQTDIERIKQTLLNMKTDWSKMFSNSELTASWQKLWDKASSGAITTKAELSALRSEVGLLNKQVEGAGLNTKTFFGQIGDNIKKFANWLFVGNLTVSAVRSMREMVDAVKAVDLQMTELRKVTDETNATYENFLSNAKKQAVELATSLDSYVESVSTFAKMGYSIEDASTLADTATIYYDVGDGLGSMDEAVQSVISTLKAYNLTADQATKVTDIFNEVSNKFAVTSGGIGSAMQRAGAALATSNTSLEKSVALWTAMNEVIQNDESSATSLRFIAQRMRNTAGELEDMGEDADGAAESVTKLQQQILKLTGVNIMSDADTFRDVYDVLKDISDVWTDITDKDRADVIRLMAGTRQSAAFSALMQNFSSAEEALNVALNSSGSAYKENEKWLNSIEAKQQKLQASFEAFSTSIMSSDLIKGVYDSGTGILGFLTTLTDKLGALPQLAATAGAALSFKNVG